MDADLYRCDRCGRRVREVALIGAGPRRDETVCALCLGATDASR